MPITTTFCSGMKVPEQLLFRREGGDTVFSGEHI